jgi:hypothetical protein
MKNSATDYDTVWAGEKEVFAISLSDVTTDLTVGTGKDSFHMPFGFLLTEVYATVGTAPAGAAVIVDVNKAGSSILGTKVTIDSATTSSRVSATPPTISDSALTINSVISFDIDQVGVSTVGKNLKVYLVGTRT